MTTKNDAEYAKEVGMRIKSLRGNSTPKLSQQAFAEMCGIDRAYLASIETGKQFPSSNILLKLKTTKNISSNWILYGKGQIFIDNPELGDNSEGRLEKTSNGLISAGDKIFVPVSPIRACCGTGFIVYPADYSLNETIAVRRKNLGTLEEEKLPFAVETEGHSMEGFGIPAGSMVIVNPAEPINSGDIILIVVDEKAAIKKFYKKPDGEDFIAATGERIHATNEELADGYYIRKCGKVMLVISPPDHGV